MKIKRLVGEKQPRVVVGSLGMPIEVMATTEDGEGQEIPAANLEANWKVVKGGVEIVSNTGPTTNAGQTQAEFRATATGPFLIVCRIGNGKNKRNARFEGEVIASPTAMPAVEPAAVPLATDEPTELPPEDFTEILPDDAAAVAPVEPAAARPANEPALPSVIVSPELLHPEPIPEAPKTKPVKIIYFPKKPATGRQEKTGPAPNEAPAATVADPADEVTDPGSPDPLMAEAAAETAPATDEPATEPDETSAATATDRQEADWMASKPEDPVKLPPGSKSSRWQAALIVTALVVGVLVLLGFMAKKMSSHATAEEERAAIMKSVHPGSRPAQAAPAAKKEPAKLTAEAAPADPDKYVCDDVVLAADGQHLVFTCHPK